MPDIDPITREALRRASQMHSHRNSRTKSEETVKSKKEPPKDKTPPKPKPPPESDPIKAFFKDKEESIILLLVLLLMDEKADPTLLPALMYLLL